MRENLRPNVGWGKDAPDFYSRFGVIEATGQSTVAYVKFLFDIARQTY